MTLTRHWSLFYDRVHFPAVSDCPSVVQPVVHIYESHDIRVASLETSIRVGILSMKPNLKKTTWCFLTVSPHADALTLCTAPSRHVLVRLDHPWCL